MTEPTKDAANPSRPAGCGPFAGAILVILAVAAAGIGRTPSHPTAPAAPEIPSIPPAPDWTYGVVVDRMADKNGESACVTSTNVAELGFPYGPTSADLCFQQTQGHGLSAYLKLHGPGQIVCHLGERCAVTVRADAGPARRFAASPPADGSTNLVFFDSPRQLAHDLRHARRFAVQATFYRNGDQALEFTTQSDLTPPEMR